MYQALGILFVLLAIAAGISFPFINRMIEKRMTGEKKETETEDSKKNKRSKKKQHQNQIQLKDVWEIEDIRDGIIVLTGNRYRAVLRLGTVDFNLMSQSEQQGVENALMKMAMALDFPIQLYTTTEMVDTRTSAREIKNNIKDLPKDMQWYGKHLLDFVEGMSNDRTINVRRSYCIISYDTAKGFTRARQELLNRASRLISAFNRAKVNAEMLESDDIINILHHHFNRIRIARPARLVEAGALNLYKSGKRGLNIEDTLFEEKVG